jgi:transcriptional regulator with XRE-family HTH domain
MPTPQIGTRLRRLRTQKGWTQTDLATKAKVHRVSVAKIEGNAMMPTVPTLTRLAKALGVTVMELLR